MRKGFTLIEILVAVAIIGILVAIGTANFGVASKKARDGKRKGDLEQIKAALEMYRTDVKEYPDTATWDVFDGGAITNGTTVYMEDIPDDPMAGYLYRYSSNGITYNLCALMELDIDGPACGVTRICKTDTSTQCNYGVTNPL